MFGVPAEIPVTKPVEPTVAIVISLLLQTPADVASIKLVVNPIQTVEVPVIAAGNGLTVATVVT